MKGTDKRKHSRFDLSVPIQVQMGAGPQMETTTRNMSAGGVYFTASKRCAVGLELKFVMALPPEFCRDSRVEVRCRSRVVRVEPHHEYQGLGVAATIVDYEFVRTSL